jgi:hypothetical protein
LVNAVVRENASVLFSDRLADTAQHLARITRVLEAQYIVSNDNLLFYTLSSS